jgi:hypothetical protein
VRVSATLEPVPALEFTDPTALDELLDLIHDRWFDADAIQLTGTNLLIPFASKAVRRASKAEIDSVLVIEQVRGYDLVDTEQIRLYDFNDVSFDEQSSRLAITTGIPLKLEVEVDEFKVVLNSPRMRRQ